MPMHKLNNVTQMRLDKWLWCARFYRTRALASSAVNGGKVHVNGERVKPAHSVRIGDSMEITRGGERYAITVRGLSLQRGPAASAQHMYLETPVSREIRARHAELRKLAALASPAPQRRPDKKSRRLIHRFKQGL
ncbi:MAG: RNA-binding protein [Gammaproteobacteria bacterium]|nr:RNA-binding protein [Gammaproteobacteria bacterium]